MFRKLTQNVEKGAKKMKILNVNIMTALLLIAVLITPLSITHADTPTTTTMNYPTVTLTSTSLDSGVFGEVWDLTQGDIEINCTYDANGLIGYFGGSIAHAWGEIGVREVGEGNFNPGGGPGGKGIWMATDYEWGANAFASDCPNPILDLDDKMILQRVGGHGEADYDLPSAPPTATMNHRVWFDRDGVDQFQAQNPLAINGSTYNTFGVYNISIRLSTINITHASAYLYINNLAQGFETNGNWSDIDLSPAGMTWTGDFDNMQVFYGLYGYGATHTIVFKDITVTGVMKTTVSMFKTFMADTGANAGMGGTETGTKTAKPLGTAYAGMIDATGSALLLGIVYDGLLFWDFDSNFVDQTTGEPVINGSIILSGGPQVNAPVKYYEQRRLSPVYWDKQSGNYVFNERDGTLVTGTAMTPSETQDLFVIQIFQDEDTLIIMIYGYGGRGTLAGAVYFDQVMWMNIADYPMGYYIFQWDDDGNNHVDSPSVDTYTEVASGFADYYA
jgi:hypothetical protein